MVFVAIVSSVLAWQTRSRERVLAGRLAARERGGHFLGESPEPGEILKHAYAAASEILPVTRFDLYRIDPDGQVEEVWTLGPEESGKLAPSLEPENPWVGNKVDAFELPHAAAEIRFHDVTFGYPGESPSLIDLSLTIPAGRRVAIVGGSGSGKSTVLRLLMRLYDPELGLVTIGNFDLREGTLV